MATTTSSQFSLNTSDILKGLLMAVLVPVLTIIQNSISTGELTFNWKNIGIAAISGLVAYLLKNFLTPSAIVMKDATAAEIKAVDQDKADVQVVPK